MPQTGLRLSLGSASWWVSFRKPSEHRSRKPQKYPYGNIATDIDIDLFINMNIQNTHINKSRKNILLNIRFTGESISHIQLIQLYVNIRNIHIMILSTCSRTGDIFNHGYTYWRTIPSIHLDDPQGYPHLWKPPHILMDGFSCRHCHFDVDICGQLEPAPWPSATST